MFYPMDSFPLLSQPFFIHWRKLKRSETKNWPGLIISSFNIGLLKQGAMLSTSTCMIFCC